MAAPAEAGRKMPWPRAIAAHATLIVFSVIFLVPLVWLITSSLKTDAQIFRIPPEWIPRPLTFRNYPGGLTFIPFWRQLLNTSVICASAVAGTIFSCSLVAYGLARLKWRGRNALFYIILGTMMLPYQVTMVPVFVMFATGTDADDVFLSMTFWGDDASEQAVDVGSIVGARVFMASD